MPHTITATCTGCTACVKICPVHAITGERKKMHLISPSLCVDCGACGLICPVDAVNDERAVRIIHLKRSQWPKPAILIPQCLCCGACLQACPVNCLDWLPAEPESHRAYPFLRDASLCLGCAFCQDTCPVEAIEMTHPVIESEKGSPA
jgi:formate hydrogenlyase subunit 6/NADH:ubiquinone oxidoreductase subunit I